MDGKATEALEEYRAGLRLAPKSPDLWAGIGQVRAKLGQWDSAIAAFNTALDYDPRASNLLQKLGDTYHLLHRYPEAIAAYRRELMLAPDLVQPHLSLAWSHLLSTGKTDTLRAALASVPLDADMGLGAGTAYGDRLALATFEGKPDTVLALVRGAGEKNLLGHWYWTAAAYRKLGRMAAWRAVLDSVYTLNEKSLREFPDYSGLHETKGSIAALRGRRDLALAELRWLKEWAAAHPQPIDNFWRIGRARIYVDLGEMDSAFAEIEPVVAGPSLTTVHYLRLDPWWDPVVRDARFEALVAKYGKGRVD